jgi:DNA-directed RNA polymerase subunit H (RpoH/RPB5)
MSTVLQLPGPTEEYKVFRMRLAQVHILSARGYYIPPRLEYLLDNTGDRAKFAAFTATEKIGKNEIMFEDLFEHSAMGEILISVLCYASFAESLALKYREKGVETRSHVNVQIITTESVPPVYPDDRFATIEIIPYQYIYINPITHDRAAGFSRVLPPDEAKVVRASYKLAGVEFQNILQTDALTLYLGAKSGDIVQTYSNNTPAGLTTSRVLYRRVV